MVGNFVPFFSNDWKTFVRFFQWLETFYAIRLLIRLTHLSEKKTCRKTTGSGVMDRMIGGITPPPEWNKQGYFYGSGEPDEIE